MKVQIFHNKILQSCSYCIFDELSSDGYMIDVGEVPPIISYVRNNQIRLKGVLLTHPHFDHIYGINELIKEYPLLKIYCSAETYNGIEDGRGSLADLYVENFQMPSKHHFVIFDDSTKILRLSFSFQILFTPGHDTGSVCYISENRIFTGDSFIPFAPVTYLWPRSNKEEAIYNERRIKELIEKNNMDVYPGHYQLLNNHTK